MPKNPRTPSYRLHKPSGRAVVTLDGKDFYLGPHGSQASRDEYDRLIAEWLANGRRLPNAAEPDELNVNELLVAYWQHAESYYRKNGQPTTELVSVRESLRPLKDLYGTLQARDFGPLALKACRQAMIQADLSRRVINSRVGRVWNP